MSRAKNSVPAALAATGSCRADALGLAAEASHAQLASAIGRQACCGASCMRLVRGQDTCPAARRRKARPEPETREFSYAAARAEQPPVTMRRTFERSVERRRARSGISLLGVLCSLCGIAVIAMVAIPAFFERERFTLDNVCELLRRDMRSAQNRAMLLRREARFVI